MNDAYFSKAKGKEKEKQKTKQRYLSHPLLLLSVHTHTHTHTHTYIPLIRLFKMCPWSSKKITFWSFFFPGEHICFSQVTKGIILLLIIVCCYALLLFGKDVCFRKINLDSSIFQAIIPSVPGLQRTIRSGFFPHNKLAISYGKSWSISMEWSFHESQSNAENRLLWPGTFTSCSIYNSDILQRHYSGWAETLINVASLSVPEFYPECHDIFHRNSSFMQFSKHD